MSYTQQQQNDLLNTLKYLDDPEGFNAQVEAVDLKHTTGSSLWDFFGQAAYGFLNELSFSTIEAYDSYMDHHYNLLDDPEKDTFQEWIAGGSAGKYSQLTGSGKAGRGVGSGFAMLATLGLSGLFGKGVVKGTANLLTKGGTKAAAARRSTDEILDFAKTISPKEGVKVVDEPFKDFTKEVASKYIDDSYKLLEEGSQLAKVDGVLNREVLDLTIENQLKNNIKNALNIVDDDILNQISKETLETITRNNPNDVHFILQNAFQKSGIKGLQGPHASRIVAAMAYDASIGLAHGTLRHMAEFIHKKTMGVERDWEQTSENYGEYTFTGDYDSTAGEFFGGWLHHAFTDAWHFSLIGPVKFLKGPIMGGGSQTGNIRRGFGMIHKTAKMYQKPLNNYSVKELKMQIEAIDEISGKVLNRQMGKAYAQKGTKWWLDVPSKVTNKSGAEVVNEAGRKELATYLGAIRRKYLMNAPVEWGKEFGKDMLASLPRMAAGVMAMNAPNLISSFYNNGWAGLSTAFGTDGEEIMSNIFMAMFFTKKPHSFNTPYTSGTFNRIFTTGKVKQYMDGKHSNLHKMISSMRTFGASEQQLASMHMHWASKVDIASHKQAESTIKRSLDETPEFAKIRDLFAPYKELESNAFVGGADLKTAYRKHINDMVKNNELTVEEGVSMMQDLHVAERVIDAYNQNTLEGKANVNSMMPEQAFNIVQSISKMTWNGKKLTIGNVRPELNTYLDKAVARAGDQSVGVKKNYIENVLKIMGVPYEYSDGVFRMPKLDHYDLGDVGVADTFFNIVNNGKKNGWIKEGTAEATREAPGQLTADQMREIKTTTDLSSNQMMELVHGPKWKKEGIPMDEMILTSPSWDIKYGDLVRARQQIQAYEVLTRGKDHDVPLQSQNQLFDYINNFFLGKESPEIRKVDKKGELITDREAIAGIGETQAFLDVFYSVVGDLNPGSRDQSRKFLSVEQANTIKEFIQGKDNQGGLFGDLFRDPRALAGFKQYINNKSMDKLGMWDLNLGFDVKSSVIQLMKDSKFNFTEDGRTPVFPNPSEIRSKVDMYVRLGKLDKDFGKELIEHYDTIFSSIQNSRFKVQFSDTLVEQGEGDYINALKRSLAVGKISMDRYVGDMSRTLKDMISLEIDKHTDIEKNMLLSVNSMEVGSKLRDAAQKELESFINQKEVLINLKNTIKTALAERDPYELRSIGRFEKDIKDIINELSMNPMNSRRLEYTKEMANLIEKIETNTKKQLLNDKDIMDFVVEELKTLKIPEKDIQDKITRITNVQFASKYGIPVRELNSILAADGMNLKTANDVRAFATEIIGDFMADPTLARDASTRDFISNLKRDMDKLAGDVEFDVKTEVGQQNWQRFVYDPVKIRLQEAISEKELTISRTEIDRDVYNIVTNAFSKMRVKSYKIDLENNKLYQYERVMGRASDRGIGAILRHLDPSQDNIMLLERSGTNTNGRVISDTNTIIDQINTALLKGNFSIENPKAKPEYLKTGDVKEMYNINMTPSKIGGERWIALPLSEKTSVLVRVDNNDGSISKQIRRKFRAPNEDINDPGGELYLKLRAVYDGNLALDTPQHKAIRDLLSRVTNARTPEDIIEAIKLTRMIENMPAYIPDVLSGGGNIKLDNKLILDLWKRDNLTETKNGYVPTAENRLKSAIVYKNAESQLYRDSYNKVSEWFENPDKKMKILSVNDGVVKDQNGEVVFNIFSSFDRAAKDLEVRKNKGEITEPEYQHNLKLIEKSSKEITDGEFFLSENAYLANLMMVGLDANMLRFNNSTMQFEGFEAGAIKPTISHGSVDVNSGRVETFFAKTAFKYDPIIGQILKDLGVDGITFKSANKINSVKDRFGVARQERYSNLNTDLSKAEGAQEMPRTWTDMLLNDPISKLENVKDNVIEVPISSFSLRNVATPKDNVTIGANVTVHMGTDTGISRWINLDAKLAEFKHHLNLAHSNPYHRTALAKMVFGERANSGDPAAVESAISSILSRNGLILEPWAMKKLEANLINHFINNGMLGGGVVKEGSLDVMSADFGDLAIPIRSINSLGEPTVRLMGEYLPSYHAAMKPFIKPGSRRDTDNVQNILVQRIVWSNGEIATIDGKSMVAKRQSDGFIVEYNREKFLLTEGQIIRSDGRIVDSNTLRPIEFSTAKESVRKEVYENNKRAYEEALRIETDVMNSISDNASLNEAAIHVHTNFKDSKFKAHKDSSIDSKLALGTLNSRQPRNMIGDIVLSRIAVREQFVSTSEGLKTELVAHTPKESGNISRMNHVDAIKPQDADFDLDKSFNYTAAPGQFFREVSRNSGYMTEVIADKKYGTPNEVVSDLFNPHLNSGMFAQKIPSMLEANNMDYSRDILFQEVNMGRGHFIKMHQTLTYMSNMFRRNDVIMTFESDMLPTANRNIQVRLNNRGKYATTVTNVSKMATMFIDAYDRLPSRMATGRLREIKNEIMFGEDGLFKLVILDKKGQEVILNPREHNLMSNQYGHVREAINNIYIDPLNRYLRYNKGTEMTQSGAEIKATMRDYHRAYVDIYNTSLDLRNKYGIDSRINPESGKRTAMEYFDKSTNPYDMAVREMHHQYVARNALKQQGEYGKGPTRMEELETYLDRGFAGMEGTAKDNHNRIFNTALKEFVADEWRIVRANELANRKRSLEIKLEDAEKFLKPGQTTTEVFELQQKLARVSELLSAVEESLSYKFAKDPANPPIVLRNTGHAEGMYRNGQNKPVVIVNNKGKIREVIQKNATNRNRIKASDKIILNGRRFKLTDGDTQKGLKTLYEAYMGIPTLTLKDGSKIRLDHAELKFHVGKVYRDLQGEVINLENNNRMLSRTKENQDRLISNRDEAIRSAIFEGSLEGKEAHQKALILRMLSPVESVGKEISARSFNVNGAKRTLYDYTYVENPLNQHVMSLLTKISTGEISGDKQFALDMLNDIQVMKNAAQLTLENRGISRDIIEARMYTEPADLNVGFLTTEKYLNQRIWDIARTGTDIQRNAAKIMIDYATGKSKGLVDDVTLYKASRAMVDAGVAIKDQWVRNEYVTNPDGSVRNFGTRQVRLSEVDRLNQKDMGEMGSARESTKESVTNIFDCLGLD